jgi:CRP/FNR family transcriptional regulator
MLCEGHTSEHFYEILEGIVRAYKILSDGRRQIINFLFPGESFGIGASDAYSYSADAVTDTTVRSLAKPALERLASGQPALAARLRDSVLRELRAAQDHLVVLGRKTAREKVPSFLLFVAEHENPSFNDGHTIWIPMSQRDIADYLGLTTETVNRVMASLRANSIISIHAHGHIRLIMVEALSDIANAA